MAPSLLIVDDHASFRGFAHSLLGAQGFDVTGEAEDGESALEQIEELHPDIVLLDVQLPGIDGFEVAWLLSHRDSPPHVVLTSSREAADYGDRLLLALSRTAAAAAATCSRIASRISRSSPSRCGGSEMVDR